MDDDDLWAPQKLNRQLEAAHAATRDWVYAGVVEIDEGDRLLGGRPPPQPEAIAANLSRRNLMPAGSSNVVIRTELAEAESFDPELRHLADWDLWLRLMQHGPPACVPEPFVAYRIHGAQASLDSTGMVREAGVLEIRHGIDRASIYRWLAWGELRQGRRMKAIQAYAGALRAGDVSSLARAAVAAMHPRPTAVRIRGSPSRHAVEWRKSAQQWLARRPSPC